MEEVIRNLQASVFTYVEQILENLRCQIRVESKLGKGTRVLLYLMKENLQVE